MYIRTNVIVYLRGIFFLAINTTRISSFLAIAPSASSIQLAITASHQKSSATSSTSNTPTPSFTGIHSTMYIHIL